LCFVHGEWPLLSAPNEYAGVRLVGTRSLRKLVMRDAFLDDYSITKIHADLAATFPPKVAAV
jgi:hypothetical protein